jgi:hypothetical protein
MTGTKKIKEGLALLLNVLTRYNVTFTPFAALRASSSLSHRGKGIN